MYPFVLQDIQPFHLCVLCLPMKGGYQLCILFLSCLLELSFFSVLPPYTYRKLLLSNFTKCVLLVKSSIFLKNWKASSAQARKFEPFMPFLRQFRSYWYHSSSRAAACFSETCKNITFKSMISFVFKFSCLGVQFCFWPRTHQ